MSNPFFSGRHNGHPVGAISAQDRIDMVRHFNRERCLQALTVGGLQKSVATAINRRLRQLKTLEKSGHDNLNTNPLVECCRCRHKHHFAQRTLNREVTESTCPRCKAKTFTRAEEQPDIFTGVSSHE